MSQNEQQRGAGFAEGLHALVVEAGPADLSATAQEQLGSYLVECAVEWVKAYNRLTRPVTQ